MERSESLSEEQLALEASPSLRPVWVLAAHIISARAGWFHSMMGEAPDRSDFDEMYDWDMDDQPQRSGAELAHGLRETWAMIAGCLERWTPDDLDKVFTTGLKSSSRDSGLSGTSSSTTCITAASSSSRWA